MASEFKSGTCWDCGNQGAVIYTKVDDLGFVCIPCASSAGAINKTCNGCSELHDCRFIAAGTLFVCDKQTEDKG